MNDFGVFKVLQDTIRADVHLSGKISAVITEKRPGLIAPYVTAHFSDLQLDIPCFIQSALLKCEIQIFSEYHGDLELHDLISRLNTLLDGAGKRVHVTAMDKPGKAVFKLLQQQMHIEQGGRMGVLSYQVKITIERSE